MGSPAAILAIWMWAAGLVADERTANRQNLNELPADLLVPAVTDEQPGAGRRVRLRNPGFSGQEACHVLYLPPEWRPHAKYPVLVEYPGNGGYQNALGDRSTGLVEDCVLGYGISGGRGMIWLCLPFIDSATRTHQTKWWGDPEATAAYCRTAVAAVCRDYGGDPRAVILTGFSRGAIACGYIGLRDDETARLWRACITHSHFDGVRRWNYPGDDRAAARQRLARLQGRPLFVCQEESVEDIRIYLAEAGHRGPTEFLALPFPNHSAEWVLKDLPQRQRLRSWLRDLLHVPGQ